MNISENLQRIKEAKADIKEALNTKQNAGITDLKLDSYADYIKIPSVDLNYDKATGGSSVGLYGEMDGFSSTGIVWTSGSVSDLFATTSTDVMTISSSSSSTRNTGYVVFNIPLKYFIYSIYIRPAQYSSAWYLPYNFKLECYNYSTKTWNLFANIDPTAQGVTIRQQTAYSFWNGLTATDINVFSKEYSPTLTDIFKNPDEKRRYRLAFTGSSYNVSLQGHVIALSRVYFRGINIAENVSGDLSWN